MVVAIVLIVIAVPSFKNLTLSSKLTTTANEFVGAINTARMEAIKRNAKTQFCSDSTTANTTTDLLGTKCGTDTGAVYTLAGASTVSLVRATAVGISTPLQISSAGVVALRFGGDGLAHDPAATDPSVAYGGPVADICTSSMKTNNHRLISMVGGSMLAVASSTNGTCP